MPEPIVDEGGEPQQRPSFARLPETQWGIDWILANKKPGDLITPAEMQPVIKLACEDTTGRGFYVVNTLIKKHLWKGHSIKIEWQRYEKIWKVLTSGDLIDAYIPKQFRKTRRVAHDTARAAGTADPKQLDPNQQSRREVAMVQSMLVRAAVEKKTQQRLLEKAQANQKITAADPEKLIEFLSG